MKKVLPFLFSALIISAFSYAYNYSAMGLYTNALGDTSQSSPGDSAYTPPPADTSTTNPPGDSTSIPPTDTTYVPPADTTQTPPDTTYTPPVDSTYTPPTDTTSTTPPGDTTVVTKQPIINTPGTNTLKATIADGTGGFVMVWENIQFLDTTVSMKVYAQRVSADRSFIWGSQGLVVAASTLNQSYPKVISDRSGGVIIAWNQGTGNTLNVYAQRISANGQRAWGDNGVALTSDTSFHHLSEIIPVGDHGTFVSWTTKDSEGNARLDGDGNKVGNPIFLSSNPNAYVEKIIPNANGETTVIYTVEITSNNETGYEHYIQIFNSGGQPVLADGGVKFIIFPAGSKFRVDDGNILSDGSGGFFVLIVDESENNKLYLQHVLNNGTTAFSGYGLVVDESTKGKAMLISDGSGGVIVSWADVRSSSQVSAVSLKSSVKTLSSSTGYYAQRFNSSGVRLWNSDDVALKASDVDESGDFTYTVDASGNVIFVIPGSQNAGNSLYGQKINLTGTTQWSNSGILIDGSNSFKSNPSIIITDDQITVLYDGSSITGTGIYSQVIMPDGVLPVNLSAFNAVARNQKVYLTWSTVSEINNDYFQIERSEDGKRFSAIAKVNGKGNSSSVQKYSFIDGASFSTGETLYYRIKQVDKDGSAQYSKPIPVKLTDLSTPVISIYPNPATNDVTIDLGNGPSRFSYKFFDLSGNVVISNTSGVSATTVDLNKLNPGVYIIQILSGEVKSSKKIVKQ